MYLLVTFLCDTDIYNIYKCFFIIFRDGKIPINKAGLLSYMFMTWMTPLVMKMFKNRNEDLKEEDIWECSDYEASKINTDR